MIEWGIRSHLLGLVSLSPDGSLVLTSPGPFIFQFPESWPLVGGAGLRWYGLLMAASVLIGLFLAKSLAEWRQLEKEPGQASEHVEQLALWLVLGGFAGARLYYVLTHLGDFEGNPLAAFAIWQGGIIIHGGVLAGALALYVYCRLTRINGWAYADTLTPSLILGQAIGRWGNFFNSEAYGTPIAPDSWWPIREFIPLDSRLPQLSTTELYHPIFLYESVLNLVLFGILYSTMRAYPKLKDGTWVWMYVIGYSLIRIPYEILRISAVAYLGSTSIKVAYLASAIGLILGISMLVYMYRFRYDPDFAAITTWMTTVSGIDAEAADNVVRRAWSIQRRNAQLDITDRVSLAMPNLPPSLTRNLPVTKRQDLMQDIFQQLGGQDPTAFTAQVVASQKDPDPGSSLDTVGSSQNPEVEASER